MEYESEQSTDSSDVQSEGVGMTDNTDTTETTDTTENEQDDQDSTETSEEGEGGEKIKVGNKELTPEQLALENQKLRKEYTRSRQSLSQMEKRLAELEGNSRSREAARHAQEAVAGLDADVKEAVLRAVLPEVERELEKRDARKATQQRLDASFDRLAQEFDGTDGKPKFDATEKDDLIAEMRESNDGIYDPYYYWKSRHEAEIDDWKEKAIARRLKNNPRTEMPSSVQGGKKPAEKKSPTSFKDADASARSRFRS